MADKNQWALDIKTLIPTLIKARTQTQLQKKVPQNKIYKRTGT